MTTLLVANDGGHLQQLVALAPRLGLADDVVWATNDSPQSRSLLAGQRVENFPHVEPRDVLGVLRGSGSAQRLIARVRPTRVVSTGASLALSVLPVATLRRIPTHYIESATRAEGFSMTGRVLQRLPAVRLYTQYPHLAGGRWTYAGSVFDGYRAQQAAEASTPRRVVVSLGTSKGYGFRSLVERLLAHLPADAQVFWQTGSTDVSGLPIGAHVAVPSAQLRAELAAADVVVCHAGTGSAIAALEAGRRPVLVPRRASAGEHVDNHQTHLAVELARRGLAWHVPVESLTGQTLVDASGWAVVPADDAPAITLRDR